MRRAALRRGASAIEFGLTLPILTLFLLAIIEYGWLFSQQTAVLYAVRDGTRVGVTFPLDEVELEAVDHVEQVLAGFGVDCAQVNCQTYTTIAGAAGSRTMRVFTTLPYDSLTGMVPVPGTLSAEMTMMLEDQD